MNTIHWGRRESIVTPPQAPIYSYAAIVLALLLMAPVTLWQSAAFDYRAVPFSAWAAVFYMALFPSVICYLIYYYALAHMEASRLAAFSYLQPLLAIFLGIVILHEHVTLGLVVSGTVIFGGVYITERARKPDSSLPIDEGRRHGAECETELRNDL